MTNLEDILNSSKFPTLEGGISCRQSDMLIALCACRSVRVSIETWAWPSTQNGSGTVRPAYSGELFAHHDTRAKSSRPCSMVAVLIVSEYTCGHLSAVWICASVPHYAPRRWRIKCMCIQVNLRETVKKQDKTITKTEIVLHKLTTKSFVIEIDT